MEFIIIVKDGRVSEILSDNPNVNIEIIDKDNACNGDVDIGEGISSRIKEVFEREDFHSVC